MMKINKLQAITLAARSRLLKRIDKRPGPPAQVLKPASGRGGGLFQLVGLKIWERDLKILRKIS